MCAPDELLQVARRKTNEPADPSKSDLAPSRHRSHRLLGQREVRRYVGDGEQGRGAARRGCAGRRRSRGSGLGSHARFSIKSPTHSRPESRR
jgi:hypothetical protein